MISKQQESNTPVEEAELISFARECNKQRNPELRTLMNLEQRVTRIETILRENSIEQVSPPENLNDA